MDDWSFLAVVDATKQLLGATATEEQVWAEEVVEDYEFPLLDSLLKETNQLSPST